MIITDNYIDNDGDIIDNEYFSNEIKEGKICGENEVKEGYENCDDEDRADVDE